jgi:hypothetical protein
VCVRIPNCPRLGGHELFNFKTFFKCSQFLAIPHGIMHYFNAPYQKPMLHIIFMNNVIVMHLFLLKVDQVKMVDDLIST